MCKIWPLPACPEARRPAPAPPGRSARLAPPRRPHFSRVCMRAAPPRTRAAWRARARHARPEVHARELATKRNVGDDLGGERGRPSSRSGRAQERPELRQEGGPEFRPRMGARGSDLCYGSRLSRIWGEFLGDPLAIRTAPRRSPDRPQNRIEGSFQANRARLLDRPAVTRRPERTPPRATQGALTKWGWRAPATGPHTKSDRDVARRYLRKHRGRHLEVAQIRPSVAEHKTLSKKLARRWATPLAMSLRSPCAPATLPLSCRLRSQPPRRSKSPAHNRNRSGPARPPAIRSGGVIRIKDSEESARTRSRGGVSKKQRRVTCGVKVPLRGARLPRLSRVALGSDPFAHGVTEATEADSGVRGASRRPGAG